MFLKRIRVTANGKWHTYWTLVKSIRTARGPRHHVVAYAAKEVIGKNVSMLMPPPHSHKHDQYIARYLQTGQPR